MSQVPILSKTSSEYCQEISILLGKGAEHALYAYQEWFREGFISGKHPAFNNAKGLLSDMLSQTDCRLLAESEGRTDGMTEKLLFKTEEGLFVESVLIPMEAGGTLCISSQVGCRMGCRFCETGKLGLLKNLSVAEIVGQVFYARHIAKGSFRNIVFMGMGEPFDHYDAVMQAFRVITDPHGLNFGPRHVTISTSGREEEIRKLANEPFIGPNLAVSINAPTDEIRNQLMPINRNIPMRALYEAIQYYNEKTGREVLAAYVLMDGVNDAPLHAELLAEYLKGLQVKINLIPYNPQSRDLYRAPSETRVSAFKEALIASGYRVLVRKTKGDQIMAACGQLGKKSLLQHKIV